MELDSLPGLRVVELREIAKKLGIKGRSRLRKAQLIQAIRATQTVPSPARRSASDPPEVPMPEKPEPTQPAPTPKSTPVSVDEVVADEVEATEDVVAEEVDEIVVDAVAAAMPESDDDTDESDDDTDEADDDTDEADDDTSDEVVAATEPDGPVYLDRGAVLPDRYPGSRLRTMIRDPEMVYVYWEVDEHHEAEAWEIRALVDSGVVHAFRVDGSQSGGYLHLPAASLVEVALCPVAGAQAGAPIAKALFLTPPDEPSHDDTAEWVAVTPEVFEERRTQLAAREEAERRPHAPPLIPIPRVDGPAGPLVDLVPVHGTPTHATQPTGYPYRPDGE